MLNTSYIIFKLPKLEFFALVNLCFISLKGLLEGARGCLLRLFKNCANPPNSNDPPVRHIIKIYERKAEDIEYYYYTISIT